MICFIKVVVLVQYQRVFVPLRIGRAYYASHAVLWINVLFYMSTFLAFLTECRPVEKSWHPDLPGRCINTQSLFIVTAAFNLASDLSIYILHLTSIIGLQMSRTRKIAVAALFTVGLLYVFQ